MMNEFKVRWELDPETGALVKIRTMETITAAQAKRRRYGLAGDAPENEVTAVETAAQAVASAQESIAARANAMPAKLAAFNPTPILIELRQRQDALEGVVTIAALRPILRTILSALADILINQHRIMVALRLTARQIADE